MVKLHDKWHPVPPYYDIEDAFAYGEDDYRWYLLNREMTTLDPAEETIPDEPALLHEEDKVITDEQASNSDPPNETEEGKKSPQWLMKLHKLAEEKGIVVYTLQMKT